MGLLSALRRPPHERAGFTLYGAAVAAARAPYFYADLGVRDSVEGRLDLIHLHAALLVRRLRRDTDKRGPALAQAVFDAMFSDMDVNLREMGVSDLVVGKRVRGLWEAFHGRATAYETALDGADQAAMAAALARNVWRGGRSRPRRAAPGPYCLCPGGLPANPGFRPASGRGGAVSGAGSHWRCCLNSLAGSF